MRGVVVFALLAALGAVVDATFFKGKHMEDAETAIVSLATISTQIGHH
jgi:hypothetical protein